MTLRVYGFLISLCILCLVSCKKKVVDDDRPTVSTVDSTTINNKFRALKIGMSYPQLKAIIGREADTMGEGMVGDDTVKAYRWDFRIPDSNYIFCQVSGKDGLEYKRKTTRTAPCADLSRRSRLRFDMYYKAVADSLGVPGDTTAHSYMYYNAEHIYCTWYDCSLPDSQLTILFYHGRVIQFIPE